MIRNYFLGLLAVSSLHGTAFADSYLFDMDVLPSADGAVYIDFTAEASVAQTINGQLVIDTTGQGSDVAARYTVADPWNTSRDAVLTWKARLEVWSKPNPISAQVDVAASTGLWLNFIMQPDRILYLESSGNFVDFSPAVSLDTSTFHTYKVTIPANSNHFDLFIDGQWVASATAGTFPGTIPRLRFGDGTSSGGNVRLRFKEVKFVNSGFVNK